MPSDDAESRSLPVAVLALVRSILVFFVATTGLVVETVTSRVRRAVRWIRDLWTRTEVRGLRERIRIGLLGRSPGISFGIALAGVVLAAAAAWWVGTTVGAERVADMAIGTWTGRSPHAAVFLAAGALVAFGAASAASNSGLLPTFALVAGPLFGVGLARYGTGYAVLGRSDVVSLPEAVATGGGVAIALGIPFAFVGFLLGVGVRRIVSDLRGNSGRITRPEGT